MYFLFYSVNDSVSFASIGNLVNLHVNATLDKTDYLKESYEEVVLSLGLSYIINYLFYINVFISIFYLYFILLQLIIMLLIL